MTGGSEQSITDVVISLTDTWQDQKTKANKSINGLLPIRLPKLSYHSVRFGKK